MLKLKLFLYLNPNQSGIPADSKGLACWYFNTNWCRSFKTNYTNATPLVL